MTQFAELDLFWQQPDSSRTPRSSTAGVAEAPRMLEESSGSVEVITERGRSARAFPHLVVTSGTLDPASVAVKFGVATDPLWVAYQGATQAWVFEPTSVTGTNPLAGWVERGSSKDARANVLRRAALDVEAARATEESSNEDIRRRVTLLLSEDPVEPGDTHPAEALLAQVAETRQFAEWLRRFYDAEPELRRSLVLCVGRLPLTKQQQGSVQAVLRDALADSSVRVREAAVRALETLDSIARDLLASYQERVPWLKSYAERVVRRLAG